MILTRMTEEIKTHFVLNNFSFFENRTVYQTMWKNIREGQATDDNFAYELCTLDT